MDPADLTAETSAAVADICSIVSFGQTLYNPVNNVTLHCVQLTDSQIPQLRRERLEEAERVLPFLIYDLPVTTESNIQPSLALKDVVRCLPFLNNGTRLLRSILIEAPVTFHQIVDMLVGIHDFLPPNCQKKIGDLLYSMCSVDSNTLDNAAVIRSKITNRHILPALALRLTLNYCNDERQWGSLQSLADSIQRKIFEKMQLELENSEPCQVQLCILLHIVCLLANMSATLFEQRELELCMEVMKHAQSERLVKLSLCFVLMSVNQPNLWSGDGIRLTLRKLTKSEHSQLFMLIALYINTRQYREIEEIVSATLGTEVLLHFSTNPWKQLEAIFVSDLFPDESLAQGALLLDPSTFSGLGVSNDPEHLSLKVFFQLLKAGTFHKTYIDIQNWIYSQIIQATTPVHPEMGPMLREYASSIFKWNTKGKSPITPIPESKIKALFQTTLVDISASHVLMLLYVLYYNEQVRIQVKHNVEKWREATTMAYSVNLLESIPIRRILTFSETADKGKAFYDIYPELLGLVAANYPEMFDVVSLLIEEERNPQSDVDLPRMIEKIPPSDVIATELESVMKMWLRAPDNAYSALKSMATWPPTCLAVNAKTIISASLPRLLDSRTQERFLDAFRQIWESMNSVIPHELAVLTVNALMPQSQEEQLNKKAEPYSQQQLMMDPPLLLRCDSRVFRCPTIFRIFIRLVGFYLVGSRHRFRRLYECERAHIDQSRFSDKNFNTMLEVQDSLTLQLLLEICEEKPADQHKREVLAEIQSITCDFLHQLFIENPNLQKLLHQQSYSTSLIPVVVKKIESMRYLPELIHQHDYEKSAFGLILASYLCEEWPMQKTLQIAREHVLPSVLEIVTAPKLPPINSTLFDIIRAAIRAAEKFPEELGELKLRMKEEMDELKRRIQDLTTEYNDTPKEEQQYSKQEWASKQERASKETVWGGTNIRVAPRKLCAAGIFQILLLQKCLLSPSSSAMSKTNVYQEEVEYLLDISENQGEETLEE
ncbi:8893_t:CDS:10 [Paraglomus brasilianum]|uniref:8893_t:CDS:1 n=1 Tax=Paraglomus brasilianum TaxID=144538 RepID=A0A9N9AQ89_9GLOM|nr:8893_t:CDS:10 [Paraglomus brasilianum]